MEKLGRKANADKTQQVTIRLRNSIYTQLNTIAEGSPFGGVNVQDVIHAAINMYLSEHGGEQ